MKLAKRILGWTIIALLLAGAVAIISIRAGVLMALAIFGLAAGFTALIVLASWLICSDE